MNIFKSFFRAKKREVRIEIKYEKTSRLQGLQRQRRGAVKIHSKSISLFVGTKSDISFFTFFPFAEQRGKTCLSSWRRREFTVTHVSTFVHSFFQFCVVSFYTFSPLLLFSRLNVRNSFCCGLKKRRKCDKSNLWPLVVIAQTDKSSQKISFGKIRKKK